MRKVALITSAAALIALPALAADQAAAPDFSGLWGRNSFDQEAPPSGPGPLVNLKRVANGSSDPDQLVGDFNNPILKPEAAEKVKQYGEISKQGLDYPDPSNHCAPYSPPFTFAMQLGLQILQGKSEVVMLYPQDDQVRRVRLNGVHPPNAVPSAMGDSIGHYEGDALVVDTVGIKVLPTTIADRYGTPQTEAMHIVERYRLIDVAEAKAAQARHENVAGRVGGPPGAMPIDPNYDKGLQLQFTVEDPNVFTTPWMGQVTFHHTRTTWQEQVCAENFHEYYNGKDTEIPQAKKPDF
jgi:hypothetical protein